MTFFTQTHLYLWPFVLTFLLCLMTYLGIKNKYISLYGRFQISYIFSPYKLKNYTGIISLLYTLLICGVCFNFAFYCVNPNELKMFGWLAHNFTASISFFFTLQLGIWGLIVSYNVLRQQKSQIVSFDEFLMELTENLQRLMIKARDQNTQIYYVYLYDYHPLIGNFSAHKRYKEYKVVLDKVLEVHNIHVSFITNHQEALAGFFEKLSIDEDYKIVQHSFEAINYIKEFEQRNKIEVDIKPRNSVIWKSKSVSEYHFVIIHDIAFQYVVLPQESGKNNIYGIKSEDPFIINYLEKSFFEKLKLVISPIDISLKEEYLYFSFEPQSNIEEIVIFDDEDNKIIEVQNLLRYNEIDVNGFVLNKNHLSSYPFYYKVKKKNTDQIVKSRRIFYREILSAQEGTKTIDYILPHKVPNNLQLEWCLERLSALIDNKAILMINVFFDKDSLIEEEVIFRVNAISKNIPINYIPQVPETSISMELTSLTDNSQKGEISYCEKNNYRVSIVELRGFKEYYFSSKEYVLDCSLDANISNKFDDLTLALAGFDLDYSDIYRQWNYIGNINKSFFVDGKEVDNYNLFCGVRKRVYESLNMNEGNYPVATGIGVASDNYFSLTAFAINEISSQNVENLKISTQDDPYKYSGGVIKGPHQPLFQRGKIITFAPDRNYTFISGTSSIRGEQSYRDESNVIYSQTKITIESIYDLLKTKSNRIISLRNMSYIRIYYTGREHYDLEIIKTFLSPIINDIPHIYLKADVCRKDLMIEIEATKY